jgi:serine protease
MRTDSYKAKWLLCLFYLLAALGCVFSSPGAVAATTLVKPANVILASGNEPSRIAVKFRDGLYVRLRDHVLVSTNAPVVASLRPFLDTVSAATWERADAVSEATMDQMWKRAEQRLGRALPDPNLQFFLTLPPSMNAEVVIQGLNRLDIVELAQPVPRSAPPPQPPNFEPQQQYCEAAPVGGGVFNVWTNYGVFGAGVQVADIEHSYNASHRDLPSIVNLTPDAVDPENDNNHGTAVLGIISALQNGWGTTGVGYGATLYFAGSEYPSGSHPRWGITSAVSQLRPGDILLIEQGYYGPNTTQEMIDQGIQFGGVPVEWFRPIYDAIVLAVGQGIIVIEPAGNGGQNLDDPIFSTGNGGHWPFLPRNNSGAIMVGAGASFNGSSTEGSRLGFSNYGSRVDVQGWGENIVTTGYGDLYDAEGTDLYYTSAFAGTSGASAMVAGEAALLQSICTHATGKLLTPPQIRRLLRNTGSSQTGGAYTAFENIGPLPNLPLAVNLALSNTGPPVVVMFSTNATALIGGTATLSVAARGAQPMTYQWQFNGTNLTDDGNVFGSTNAELILNRLTAAEAGSYSVTVSNLAGAVGATGILSVISDPALTPGVTLTPFHTFTGASDGSGPVGLTADGSGHFYGVQQYGGKNGYGCIVKFTQATRSFSVLYSFTNGVDGGDPWTPLVLGSDGNFYGTSWDGGEYDSGAIFSISPSGTFKHLYTFTGKDDGANSQGRLVEGPNHLFYGTTSSGGSGRTNGIIFTVDASGDYKVIHTFDFANGAAPQCGLVLASDGNFYSTTNLGGTNNDGTIFRITPGGTFSSLFSFDSTNGMNPSDNLVQALDGKLYGSAYGGGAYGLGTIISITTNGAFQLLLTFDGTNGAYPYAGLFAGRDGNLYGLTVGGSPNDQDGVIYEITPDGVFDIVARFDGLKGMYPYAPLVRGGDGDFYGITWEGGYGCGVMFRLSFASTPRPSLQCVPQDNGQIDLTWSAVTGRSYQVQSTTNFSQGIWTPAGAPITATNLALKATDVLPRKSETFYRLALFLP